MDTPIPASEFLKSHPLPETEAGLAQISDEDKAAAEQFGKRRQEKEVKFPKARKVLGGLAVASICALPAADLALSDAVGIKIYTEVNDAIKHDNKAIEHGLEIGANSGIIMAEIMGLGVIVARNRRMRRIFGRYDEYLEEKYANMSWKRKAFSYTVSSPLLAIAAVGKGVQKAGEVLDRRNNKVVSTVGKGLIDVGSTNAIGTNGVILQEVMAGKPPSTKRIAWLGTAMTGSWMGIAEGVRSSYERFPAVRPSIDWAGRAFEILTSVNILHPWDTPVASIVMGSIATGLAVSSNNLNNYVEKKEAEEALESDDKPA